MKDIRRDLGLAGEDTAAAVVDEAGLTVLGRNWRDGRRGEIDLIAADPASGTIVVIEVKTRVGNRLGSALEAVDSRKLRRLRGLGGAWLRATGTRARARVDAIAITVPDRASARRAVADRMTDLRECGARIDWVEGLS
ncbi:YraN family protein [Actinomyces sp. B33]|uniref:YraN family protein n=1 Tax=Actinomyces sp. B33 TaxID=2942131 RepID=UPI0023428941|nr:YraN family protein [Actinomyces sp. B33]MDC4232957.1 YraN family protein [Actinomyces sp. B33]